MIVSKAPAMAPFPPSVDAGLAYFPQALTPYLRAAYLDPAVTSLRCWQAGPYLVLEVDHPPPEVTHGEQVLTVLQGGLEELLPALPWADWQGDSGCQLGVRIYLKVRDAAQPYGIRSFTWSRLESGRATPDHQAAGSPLCGAEARSALPDAAIQLAPKPTWRGWVSPWLNNQVTALVANYWAGGVAVLMLVVSGCLVYGFTRPCVVGGCDRLERSRAFYQLAQTALRADSTNTNVVAVQADLQAAVDLLTPIPIWSVHYGSAQAGLDRYSPVLASLKTVLQAQQKAFSAAQLSQTPPHPVERWVTIHLLWQQAIDQLTTIGLPSPAYDYAQKKLMVYRANYSLIGGRVMAEEAAEANFNTAIQTAQLARQRMDSSHSLAGWQVATKAWQAAITQLSLIPQGTLIYPQAQAHLQDYRQQLARSLNQVAIETASTHRYDQAMQAARMAAARGAKGQWRLAVGDWQQALAYIQQIPVDRTLFKEVPTLVETYQTNLGYAQTQMKRSQSLVGVTTALGKICGAANCTVAADNDQIRLNLPFAYAQGLKQALSLPQQGGSNQLGPGLKSLIDTIINVSHQLKQVVVIYDGEGHLVARYQPDLGGFSRALDRGGI